MSRSNLHAFDRRLLVVPLLLLSAVACASPATSPTQDPALSPAAGDAAAPDAPDADRPLRISAIPDQDPEKLQRLYGLLATRLSTDLGVAVEYLPVTDYTASVTAFKVGDLDLVWYGGLTGAQTRLQVPGAHAIAQRDIDAEFHSVFIANKASGLAPFADIEGLGALKGHSFTFGSESSTSGRLMPQHFLSQAGVKLTDFKGEPGFSGAHDKTIKLVESGSYEAGVLNEQVWKSRTEAGEVDDSKVQLLWRSPAYYDYHWVLSPEVAARFGADMPERIRQALLGLDASKPEDKTLLDLFGAAKFIPTADENYHDIEAVGRDAGLIK